MQAKLLKAFTFYVTSFWNKKEKYFFVWNACNGAQRKVTGYL